MREILHFSRNNNLAEFPIPPDSIELEWDSELLDRLGILTYALDLKGRKSQKHEYFEQPMFVIPNEERLEIEDYFDEELFEDDVKVEFEDYFDEELFEDDVKVEFENPYPQMPPWKQKKESSPMGEDDADSFTGSPPYVSKDGTMKAGDYRELDELEGMEYYAWYSPDGPSKSPHGIYIRRGAAAIISRNWFKAARSRYDAWCLASKLLLYHEYFHFLAQYHCDRISFSTPIEDKYYRYNLWSSGNPDAIEEAVANAYAFMKSKLDKDEKKLVAAWFAHQPSPYSDYVQYINAKLNKGFAGVLMQQDSLRELPPSITGCDLKATIFAPRPLYPVPVYFVDDAIPGIHSPKMVTFEYISYSRQVLKTKRKGRLPKEVFDKIDELIHAIKGESVDRLSELHRMNSKTHWKQNIKGNKYRAIWTQVKNINGWVIIFVGTHDQYTNYQNRHSL
jgi:hypothetical protein